MKHTLCIKQIINTSRVSLRGALCTIHRHSFQKISQMEHLIGVIHKNFIWAPTTGFDLWVKIIETSFKNLGNKFISPAMDV